MSRSPDTTKLYDNLNSQVHVWYCLPPAIQAKKKLAKYETVLSSQEIKRYQQFQFEKDKHSYLVSHALLRYALSQYAEVAPKQWQFDSGQHGKPHLLATGELSTICFNLSHTDGLAACVISKRRACGIDVEHRLRKNNLMAVARRMFAEEELLSLERKHIEQQHVEQQFYALWTLREAYVKALGTGLAGSAKEFYFKIDNKDLSVQLFHKKRQTCDTNNWYFSLHNPTAEHTLALAYESAEDVSLQVNLFIP